MKKLFLLLLFFFCGATVYGDGVSTMMSKARQMYLNQQYGQAMKLGVASLDAMFQQTMSNMASYVPELDGHQVINTNMHYEFTAIDGFSEYSFHLAKTMTNEEDSVIVSIINSPSEVERLHSLSISYDFLENKGDYKKLDFTRSGQKYEYIQDGNYAYLIFIFDQDEATQEILSGMLLRVYVTFKKNNSRTTRDKVIKSYLYEIMGKLKWKSLRYILK